MTVLRFPSREVPMTDDRTPLDVEDTAAFDDAFFETLATSIEDAAAEAPLAPPDSPLVPEALAPPPAPVIRLWPRRIAAAVAAAAALALGVFLLPEDPSPTLAESGTTETPDAELVAEARALGRAVLAETMAGAIDTDADAVLGGTDWLAEADGAWVPSASIAEQLADLDDDTLDDLFTPL